MATDPDTGTFLDPAAVTLGRTQLIEASAGTGKTYTLSSLFLRLMLKGYEVDQVLVVTFTEAASAELRDRIRSRLREALAALTRGRLDDPFLAAVVESRPETARALSGRLQRALSGFDQAAVFTIHAFCRRVLQENAFESGIGFDPELMPDARPLYQEIVSDFWALEVYDAPGWAVRLLESEKISPPSLVPLVEQTAGQPDRLVLPQDINGAGATQGLEAVFARARQIWLSQRDDITALLESHPGINRRSYNKGNLKRWLGCAAAYLEAEMPSGPPEKGGIDKFTRSRLATSAKNTAGAPRHPFFDACEDLWTFPRRWVLSFRLRLIRFARQESSRRKSELGIQLFDDLIHQLKAALDGPAGRLLAQNIGKRYPAALIDEFQDTDQAQYHIFQQIYTGKAPFFLIGDPKQSIYAFRGADIFAYLKAIEDARNRTHTLGVNWRADPALVRAVNTLFSRLEQPFVYPQIGFSPVSTPPDAKDRLVRGGRCAAAMRLLFIPRDRGNENERKPVTRTEFGRRLPERVAADVSRLLADDTVVIRNPADEPLHPGHIAVLVRTNLQARQMQAALGQLGIPSVLASAESVFESNEAIDLWRLLKAVAEPADPARIKAALATDLFGLTARDLMDLDLDDQRWETWGACFDKWHRLWRSGAFIRMMEDIFAFQADHRTVPLISGLLAMAGGERRVANLQHLAELLLEAFRQGHLGIQGLLRWFGRQLADTGRPAEASELRLESDERAVKLVTIHKAKGLEYPLVYVPYAWHVKTQTGRPDTVAFHDPGRADAPVIDLGSDDLEAHTQLARQEERAESFRLLYVALTRARHHCTVVWGAVAGFEQSPMAALLHHRSGESCPDTLAGIVARLSDEEIRADLDRLSDRSQGAVLVDSAGWEPGIGYTPKWPVPTDLSHRALKRNLGRGWRSASFSSLAAEKGEPTPDRDSGRDHDATVPADHGPVPYGGFGDRPGDHQIALLDFDRGPRAGDFFHAIMEKHDFENRDPAALRDRVAGQLTAFGYDPDRWGPLLCGAITDVLSCPLDHRVPGLTLNRIPMTGRFNELAFVFPVAHGQDSGHPPLSAAGLAAVLTGSPVSEAYRQSLSRLAFAPLRGFMKGFVDLIFQHQGRWYLVDYKSNFLGGQYRDYAPTALAAVMADHHYFLQYHIYAVALHRYLACRLPGYDYDTHFGGIYYLFIRGMSPRTGPACGIFGDRPPRDRIEALSRLFGKGGPV